MRIHQEKLLTRAIDGLYSCATDEAAWPHALEAVARVFDSPRLGLLQTTAAVDRVLDMKGVNFDSDSQARYNRYYWELDPTLDASRKAPDGAWADCSSLFDPATTRHREYVHDYALPSGLRWVAGGKVRAGDGCVILGLQRPADARPFDGDAEVLFRRLRPHLKRVCLVAGELQTARRHAALGVATINGLQQAALAVSPTGAVLFANEAGEAQLRSGRPFASRNGRLEAAAPAARRLEAAIQAATAPRHRSASGWAEQGADGSHWIVRVVPLDSDPGCALVYVCSTNSPLPATALLEGIFVLTNAEAEIARQLAGGLSVKEVAFARRVSELTVRAQVRSIIAKTGARRLAGLQALVRSVPSLAADARDDPG
jgi:DNA-binding CsgD family transcriptional regulator